MISGFVSVDGSLGRLSTTGREVVTGKELTLELVVPELVVLELVVLELVVLELVVLELVVLELVAFELVVLELVDLELADLEFVFFDSAPLSISLPSSYVVVVVVTRW